MQFSDTSTRQGLIQDCEDLTGLGATGISGDSSKLQQFTRWINIHNQKVTTMILESMDDFDYDDKNQTDYPVGEFTGTTNRDYGFPAALKLLQLKRVDVTPDGTNYYPATPFDSGAYGSALGNDTLTDAKFSITSPRYDVKYGSLWLYPKFTAAQVSAGAKIRVEYFREPIEFTTGSTTAEPGFDEPFHRILSVGAALDYAVTYNKPSRGDLAQMYTDFEARLKRYYGKKNRDTTLSLDSIYDSSYGS